MRISKSLPASTLVLLGLALTLTGCGGLSGGVPNSPGGGTATVPVVQHVAVVTLENANYGDVIGPGNMPYLTSLMASGSLAAKYYANSHPSITNYFIMTTGQAITNDDGFGDIVNTDNAARELNASKKSWKVYAESIPAPGYLGGDSGLYVRHHNPFSYFNDVQQSSAQAANIVPFTQLPTDLTANALPNYSFIVPNIENDAHNCLDGTTTSCTLGSRLQRADLWLKTNIAPLLADPNFQKSGLLIITFDESADDITNGGGHVVTVLAGTNVKAGYTGSTTQYDHRSLLTLTLKALAVSTVPNGADAAPLMAEFFK